MTDMHAVGRWCARAVGFTVTSWAGILLATLIAGAFLWFVLVFRKWLLFALPGLILLHYFGQTMAREGAA